MYRGSVLRYVASVRAVSPGSPTGGGSTLATPEAYPLSGATDLLGRMPVRLRAEDGDLVAYGFEGQRIAIPATEIGAICLHRGWGKRRGRSGPALVVLDNHGRMLLRAPGIWAAAVAGRGTKPTGYKINPGSFDKLCVSLGIARAKSLTTRDARRQGPHWKHAPGYRTVRIRSRGYVFTRLMLAVTGVVVGLLAVTASVLIARALPPGVGAARILIGLLLSVAAVWGTVWLCGVALRALNWLAVSLHVRSLAPLDRFFGGERGRNHRAKAWLTNLMILAIPALIVWGPVIGLISLTHGFADQALVTSLRHSGVRAPGLVVNVPTYSTDDNGNPVLVSHATLQFMTKDGVSVRTPDPAIGGSTWPMNPKQPVEVVYDPAHPSTAAVAGQISGSPWHGAPTGNVVSGALLTAALVPLTWLTARRIRAARRATREEFFEVIA